MKKIIGTVPFVNSYPLTFYINNIDPNINLKFLSKQSDGILNPEESEYIIITDC